MFHPLSYADIFSPWSGCRVGLVVQNGNPGDKYINFCTVLLAEFYGVEMHTWDGGNDWDALAISGGGNMGQHSPWKPNRERFRVPALDSGIPVTVLPQSFNGPDEDWERYDRIYAREIVSMTENPDDSNMRLAPDLTLFYNWKLPPQIYNQKPELILLRDDKEGLFVPQHAGVAKIAIANPWKEIAYHYASRIAAYRRLVTDKLHAAILGLQLGLSVTLLPCSYHKNLAMYETWLKHFVNCHWSDNHHAVSRLSDTA